MKIYHDKDLSADELKVITMGLEACGIPKGAKITNKEFARVIREGLRKYWNIEEEKTEMKVDLSDKKRIYEALNLKAEPKEDKIFKDKDGNEILIDEIVEKCKHRFTGEPLNSSYRGVARLAK